ncbi:MAG: hypothetical protein EA352_06335 [Gemmatimonadales bacterium]|nr:MAG: hypothetical protein EA352_06335 [Gemmatimonadales bacterium]
MVKRSFLAGMVLALGLLVVACDTSTDPEDVSLQGNWDGVGALEATLPGVRLSLDEASNGTISGSWRRGSLTGGVSGTNQAGVVEIELINFELGTTTFEGRVTNRYRMEGGLSQGTVEEAVFRRSSF